MAEKNQKPVTVRRKKDRGARQRKRFFRFFVVVGGFCVVLLLLVYGAGKLAGPVALSNAQDGFRAYFASFSPGPGYPFTLDRGAWRQIAGDSSGIIMLEGDNVTVRNSTAKTTYSKKFAYMNPAMVSAFGRTLVYDRTGGSFFLHSATQLLHEKKLDENMLTAALAKNGNIAVVTVKQDAQSYLTVLDRNLEEKFAFACVKERIASVSFSQNGKRVAVIAVSAQDAQIYSRLLVFQIGEKKPLFEETYSAVLLMQVNYTAQGKLLLFADSFFRVYNKDYKAEAEQTYPAGALRLLRVDDSGRCTFSVQQYGESNTQKLYVYSEKGIKEQETEYAGIMDIACGKSHTAVLEEGKLTVFNTQGIAVKEFALGEYYSKILLSGKQVYAMNPEKIAQFSF